MSDIRYKWNDGLNSVQISSDVSLPQFKVLGHRQKTIEASLSTGKMQMLESVMCAVWTTNYYMTDAMITTTTTILGLQFLGLLLLLPLLLNYSKYTTSLAKMKHCKWSGSWQISFLIEPWAWDCSLARSLQVVSLGLRKYKQRYQQRGLKGSFFQQLKKTELIIRKCFGVD